MDKYKEIMDIIYKKINEYDYILDYKIVMEYLMSNLEKENLKLFETSVNKLEKIAYDIPFDKAMDIVYDMKPFGEHWSYDDIKVYLENKDIHSDYKTYYLVMNMVYNDYYDVAVNYGVQDDENFFFELAYSFINDIDGKEFKVERYFL